MKRSIVARIIENRCISGDVYRITLHAPTLVSSALPGQFVQVRVGATVQPLLRRPFSIHAVDVATGSLSLLYRVVGEGSALLAKVPEQASVDILGPLGKGFPCTDIKGTALLVGGGMGAAPMVFMAKTLVAQKIPVRFYLGLDQKNTALVDAFRELLPAEGCELILASDSKATGYFHGFITDALAKDLAFHAALKNGAQAFACGPWLMFRSFKDVVKHYDIKAYLSLEEHMACGVGSCLGCVVKQSNTDTYIKVCTDGPVVPLEMVDLDHNVI